MITKVQCAEREIARCLTRATGERLFYEKAGPCAVPVPRSEVIWERDSFGGTFSAFCDVPDDSSYLLLP